MKQLTLYGDYFVEDEKELTGADNFGVDFELFHDFEVRLKRFIKIVSITKEQ